MTSRFELGERLRTLRKTKSISGEELARQIGVNQSTVSRIESGQLCPDLEFVGKFASALKLSRSEKKHLIEVSQAFLVDFDRWNSEETGTIAKLQKISQKREQESETIQNYSGLIIPGLFQTSGYIDSLFRLIGEDSEQLRKKAINSRTARQRAAHSQDKNFQYVILEDALCTAVGNEAVMRHQRVKLKSWIYGDRGLKIRILPRKAQLVCFPMTHFSIYDGRFVTIEIETRNLNFWGRAEVDTYQQLFSRVWASSVSANEANALIDSYN